MGSTDRDGSEYLDAVPRSDENGAAVSPLEGGAPEENDRSPEPAQQWFGDGLPMMPPPPPYAQQPGTPQPGGQQPGGPVGGPQPGADPAGHGQGGWSTSYEQSPEVSSFLHAPESSYAPQTPDGDPYSQHAPEGGPYLPHGPNGDPYAPPRPQDGTQYGQWPEPPPSYGQSGQYGQQPPEPPPYAHQAGSAPYPQQPAESAAGSPVEPAGGERPAAGNSWLMDQFGDGSGSAGADAGYRGVADGSSPSSPSFPSSPSSPSAPSVPGYPSASSPSPAFSASDGAGTGSAGWDPADDGGDPWAEEPSTVQIRPSEPTVPRHRDDATETHRLGGRASADPGRAERDTGVPISEDDKETERLQGLPLPPDHSDASSEDVPDPEPLPPVDTPPAPDAGHAAGTSQAPGPQYHVPSPYGPAAQDPGATGAAGAPADPYAAADRQGGSSEPTLPPPPAYAQPPRSPGGPPQGPDTPPGQSAPPAYPGAPGQMPGPGTPGQWSGQRAQPGPAGQYGQAGPSAPPQAGGGPGAPAYGPTYATGGYPQVGEDGLAPPPNADSLNADTLVRGRQQRGGHGWRKVVHIATFGLVNPGESPSDIENRERMAKIKTAVAGGHYRLAVLSLKGGVGKTTTTVALGSTLASLRGDRVLAVDANPDRGTLSDKVKLETNATIRDLLRERHLIQRYADFRAFTSQAPSRLEVLASDRDPAVSEAFSEEDYREVAKILEHYYSICITDCGTGLLHSAMRGVLGLADQIVLVSSPSVDGARSASATLDWLDAHEYRHLVHGAVVVLSMVRPKGKSSVDLDQLEHHFRQRCREVVRVPWDSHLEEGAEVDLEKLHPSTRSSYLQLAASVGEAFAWPR